MINNKKTSFQFSVFSFQRCIAWALSSLKTKNIKLKTSSCARGFTLIETFVAITILAASIVGPLAIAAKGLSAAQTASNQTIAIYLAQDAMEYIHFIRDSNQLADNSWLANLDPSCISTDGSRACYFDTTQSPSTPGNITQCSGACPVLLWDSSTSFYNYGPSSGTNAQSKFTRTVFVTFPANGNNCLGVNGCEAAVTVTVSWLDGSISHSFSVRGNIFKWQK